MSGEQTLAGLGGIALVGVNYWTGQQRAPISSLLSGTSSTAAHSSLVELGGELLLVGVAVAIAGASPAAGKAVLAAVVALWILWAINHYSGSSAKAKAKTSSSSGGGSKSA